MSGDDPFTRAVERLFARLGQSAVHCDASGIERPARVISRQPDVVGAFGNTHLVMSTTRFDLCVAEVATPSEGDTLIVAGQSYRIQGAPVRDRDGLLCGPCRPTWFDMRLLAALSGELDKIMADELKGAERAVTTGVRLATEGLKTDLRTQITAAGMGQRLANTWRGEVYPKGQLSLSAAGLVFSPLRQTSCRLNKITPGAATKDRNGQAQ